MLQRVLKDEANSNAGPSRYRLGFNRSQAQSVAITQIKDWTRTRFEVPDEAPILVTEVSCAQEGCPPLQTMVAFWTDAGDRHHFKLRMSAEQVRQEDIAQLSFVDGVFSIEGSGSECC